MTSTAGPELALMSGFGAALVTVTVAMAGLIVRGGRQSAGQDPDEPADHPAEDG